jgi:hypothetical protein
VSAPVDLDRLLRRFIAGACPQSALARALETELDRLVGGGEALAARRAELRRIAPEALASYEQMAQSALRQLYAEHFVAARDELRRAEQALGALSRALAALDDQLGAAQELEALIVEHDLERVHSLPVLRIPARLLNRAKELLDGGEHRKAAFQARLARRLVSRLCERATVTAPDLMVRLNRLAAELRASAAGDPEVASAIRRIAEHGRVYLARCLADDLENRVLGRYRHRYAGFHGESQSSPASLAETLGDTAARSAELGRRLAAWARE